MKTTQLQICRMNFNRIQTSIVVIALVFIIILLTNVTVYSQNTRELTQAIQSLQKSSTSLDHSKSEKIKNLVYDIQPTVYISSKEVKTFIDGKPLVADLDISEISKLYSKKSIFEKVELVKIRVNNPTQANTKLNIPLLAHLTSLKYVQFVFSYNTSSRNIDALYVPDGRVSVFYTIELPE